jgi:hypothetical protein
MEKLLEAVFPGPAMPRLYNEDQLPLLVSTSLERERAGRQLRVLVVRSEKLLAADGNISGTQRKGGTSAFGSCYQAEQ